MWYILTLINAVYQKFYTEADLDPQIDMQPFFLENSISGEVRVAIQTCLSPRQSEVVVSVTKKLSAESQRHR